MTSTEVNTLIRWAADEGWNPGLDDAEAFHQADPEGFIMACDNGELQAGISVIRQGQNHGFLGLYICRPDQRGKGIGWSVWQAGMQYLTGRSIGLDGVVAQQENYRKSGFEFAYRNIRFAGSTQTIRTAPARSTAAASSGITGCRPLASADLPALLSMDTKVHGLDRGSFLNHWLSDTDHRCSLAHEGSDGLTGFGTIRQCVEGFKIGPLIAQDPDTAQLLLQELTRLVDARHIILDVPEPNLAAMRLAELSGLSAVFETARMYKGAPPRYQLEQLYGVTTLELG